MHVEEYGTGRRPVLAIHGWGGTHRDFAPLARHLPGDARLLAVDLPGYGRTPAPPVLNLSHVAAGLARIAGERDLSGVTLVGFCSGAVLALMAADLCASRVARVVLIDPFAYVPWYFRLFAAGAAGRAAYRASFASPLGRRAATAILRRRQRTNDDFMASFAEVDHDAALQWLRRLNDIGRADRFAKTRLPVAIAHGERTFSAVRASVLEYRRLLPQARVTVLRGVGHLPLVRGARQIADLLFPGSNGGGNLPETEAQDCVSDRTAESRPDRSRFNATGRESGRAG